MRLGREADTAAEGVWRDRPARALSGILLPPELECLRPVFAGRMLALARERAEDTGVGADRVLIGAGLIDEEAYLRRLAHRLGLAFETFAGADAATCPLPPERLTDAAASGLLPLRYGPELVWVVAPRGLAARRLADLMAAAPELAGRLRLTTTLRIDGFIQTLGRSALARRAADGLRERRPDLSAAPGPRPHRRFASALAAMPLIGATVLFPVALFETVAAVLALWFLAFLGLRLTASLAARPSPARMPRLSDDRLPVYTVIAALYHEANSVSGLVEAIRRLDYPGIMAQTPQAVA
ncbi:MAG: hypothetical protein EPO23_07815 [Xanthobacteraceae bacterium]|nr:MAG: hypothetical protein EPO23_07815 [Xanthobacteraceae bacterium]